MQDQKLDEILAELRIIKGAFPDDGSGNIDAEGHRRYHEEMIEAAKAQTAFWRELKLDLAKKGLWGLLIILLGLVMSGLALKVGIPWTPSNK
jgi:hypothetical protein